MEWDKTGNLPITTYQLPSWAKQTRPGEINLLYCQFKISLDREKQRKIKITPFFPLASPSSQAQLYSFILDSLASATQGYGE